MEGVAALGRARIRRTEIFCGEHGHNGAGRAPVEGPSSWSSAAAPSVEIWRVACDQPQGPSLLPATPGRLAHAARDTSPSRDMIRRAIPRPRRCYHRRRLHRGGSDAPEARPIPAREKKASKAEMRRGGVELHSLRFWPAGDPSPRTSRAKRLQRSAARSSPPALSSSCRPLPHLATPGRPRAAAEPLDLVASCAAPTQPEARSYYESAARPAPFVSSSQAATETGTSQ